MGGVFLGMPGPWAEDYREKADHYTTKIGGLPDWPTPEMGIDPDLLKCRDCGGRLCLVAQVYAPISSPEALIEERVIYVLGCPMPNCGKTPGSWRVLRVQKCRGELPQEETMALDESSTPSSKISDFREADLSMDASEEDSDSDVDLQELGRALSKAASLISNSKKQNGTKHSEARGKGPVPTQRVTDATITVVPCFYIWSEKETPLDDFGTTCANYSSLSLKEDGVPLDHEKEGQHRARGSRHRGELGKDKASDNEDEEEWTHETYEYDKALGADRTYLKFKKRIDACPEQCFRYSFGGSPLLATTDLVKLDTCGICGSLRHFEMQLMPPLLYFLHQATDGSRAYSLENWSWMTLIVYTCSRSCCPSQCKEKPSNCCWDVAEEAIINQDDLVKLILTLLSYFQAAADVQVPCWWKADVLVLCGMNVCILMFVAYNYLGCKNLYVIVLVI